MVINGKYGPGEKYAGKGLKKYVRSSIYSRVVLIIVFASLILFIAFGILFRSVYEHYLNSVIRQNGNNIGSVVEGALYHSMLENNKSTLQATLDIINTMSGIDDVNMYDKEDRLVYSSFVTGTESHSNPDCRQCHQDIGTMFPSREKSYRIIDTRTNCIMDENDSDHRHLLIRSPILNERSCYTASCHAHPENEEVLGSLIIKMPLTDLDNAVKGSSARFYVAATLITFLLLVFLILFTRSKIKTPLNDLIRASLAVSSGNKDARIKIEPGQLDDMRMVSQTFNDMLDNLQSAADELKNWSQQLEYKVRKKSEELGAVRNELMHIERISSLGKLSSSVAHELNNPLSGILVYTKLIQKQMAYQDLSPAKKESVIRNLKLIENETKRCGEIVKGLLDFSRSDQEGFETRHLHEIIEETYELMLHSTRLAAINFSKNLVAETDSVWCNSNQVKQACVAVIVNASEAITDNGEIIISTSNPDDETVRLDITDNGIGISPDDLPHIFEPFFSTKHDTSGIGLGLAIVHGIIKSHNGRITVSSEPGRGTTISLFFPLVSK